MKKILRASVSLAGVFAAFFFVVTLISIFTEMSDAMAGILSIPVMVAVAWVIWRSTGGETVGVALAVFGGALIVGAVGFTCGFVGPLIFFPDANQGPLLGLFITGPVGIVVGAIGGLIFCSSQKNKGADAKSM